MGILDSIVGWIAEQIMNLLDLVTGSVLGALGCDMSVFIRYFPAAETMYEVFVAIAVGFILLNLVWQLFKTMERASASVRRIRASCFFARFYSCSWPCSQTKL